MDSNFTIDEVGGEAKQTTVGLSPDHDDTEQPSQPQRSMDSESLSDKEQFIKRPDSESGWYQPKKPDSFQMKLAGKTVQLEYRVVPIIGQYVAAMIILIAMTVPSFNLPNYGYGVAFSAIAMALSLTGTICYYTTPNFMEKSLPGSSIILQSITYSAALSIFLWLWWLVGVGILTFNGPFLVSSNGYFACWAGFGFATKALLNDLDSTGWIDGILYGTQRNKDLLLGACIVLLCTLPRSIGSSSRTPILDLEGEGLELLLTSAQVASFSNHRGEAIFALIVVLMTIPVSLFSKFSRTPSWAKGPAFERAVGILWGILVILWLVMACLNTFRGPFSQTGNGYFASWTGLASCVTLAVFSNDPNTPQNRAEPTSTDIVVAVNPSSTSDSRKKPGIPSPELRMPRFSISSHSRRSDTQSQSDSQYNGPAEV